MACDMFLQIEGIKGDSTDDAHKQWIEIDSFNHSISQSGGGASSAQGTHAGGRCDHSDFTVIKNLDSASPTLAVYACTAKPIPTITFELCRAMGEKTVFMKYTLKESIVSSIQTGGAAEGPVPTESISFRYGEVHWEYTPTDPKGGGKTGAAVKGNWSTLINKSV